MIRSRVAKRYALALFEAAQERGALEAVEADLNLLTAEYQAAEPFRRLVNSPVIENRSKQQAFKKTFSGKISNLVMNFMLLLFAKNREAYFLPVVHHFRELLDEYRGILRGEVLAPVPLTKRQLAELKAQLDARTGKDVILTQRQDESLLGGFVVRIQDIIIDTSLRHQLERLKQHLIEQV